ncbi:unnamed protein product [Rhizoctonia solani]|uniref:methylated diphthine methylhydrolase n=1 Tax=Rhizoctonia solani TaxID=456999 RepID=A0A8H2XMI4_9AGAM|nr:unnamed protein product [Rhizoctonia solani]
MSSSECIERTILSIDTELPADSVEFCPRENFHDILICGTYNLVKNEEGEKEAEDASKKPQERNGRCLVYEFNEGFMSLQEIQRIDTAAILDIKWSYNQSAFNPLLALAESVGRVQLYEWRGQEKSLSNVQSIQVAEPSVLCLSIDWNNRLVPQEAGALIVSRSDGEVSVLRPHGSQFKVDTTWHAHDYEPWVAAWNYWSPTVAYSGGDDCKLKGWDTRTSCDVPIFTNKRFEAGVTCIQTHPFLENVVAVGSYDNTVRIFDSRKMTLALTEVGVGGGAWRVKWHPLPARKDELLVACMHDGFKVVKLPFNEGGQLDAVSTPVVSHRFDAHTSLAYGVDWHHGSLTNDPAKSLVASCSFYDHTLCLWSPQ